MPRYGRGRNAPLISGAVLAELTTSGDGPDTPPVDLCALLVDARGCARGPEDFVHPDAAAHAARAAVHAMSAPVAGAAGAREPGASREAPASAHEPSAGGAFVAGTVWMDLDALDETVAAVLLVARGPSGLEGRLPGLRLRVFAGGGQAAACKRAAADGEPAAVLGALRRDGAGWRFRPVGQGYRTGLAGLAAAHGLRRDALPALPAFPGGGPAGSQARTPSGSGSGEPVAPSGPTAFAAAPLRREPAPRAGRPVPVTLTRASPEVGLAAQGGTSGALTVTLDRMSTRAGGAEPPPARLGALYELAGGRKGVVQALGGALGAFDRPPYLALRPADEAAVENVLARGGTVPRTGRTGLPDDAGAAGETVCLNLDFSVRFRRVLFFLMVGHGSGSLAGLRATAMLRPEHGAPIAVPLEECAIDAQVCALALLAPGQTGLTVYREAHWIARRHGVSPQRTLDYAYGWALTWSPRRS